MEATTPELGPVSLCRVQNPVSSAVATPLFSRNFLSRRLTINRSELSKFLDQNHIVKAYELCRYLETCCRAFEQPLRLKTSSEDSIIFLLCMQLERLGRDRVSVCARDQ